MEARIEIEEQGQDQDQIAEEPAAKSRSCLMCGGEFESDGPHHRICPRCKSTETWRRG